MDLERTVTEMGKDISEIKVALKGYNGGLGLIPTFERHCEQDRDFHADYYHFKRWCIGIFCFAVGSGALGMGALKLLQVI